MVIESVPIGWLLEEMVAVLVQLPPARACASNERLPAAPGARSPSGIVWLTMSKQPPEIMLSSTTLVASWLPLLL
jgi:hypothetical protein